MVFRTIASVAIFSALIASARADELRAFGHDLSLLKNSDMQTVLRVDGRQIHENQYVTFEEIAVVAGIPVVVGSSSPGGNACEGSPFVISFPADKAPRLDGPIDSCRLIRYEIEADRIVFTTPASATNPGQAWEWTPAGFEKGPSVAFSPDRTKGWDELRSREVDHPADLLSYGEVADQIFSLLGSDRDDVLPIVEGVGSAEYRGDFLVGSSCLPHSCSLIEQITVASLQDRRVFVAWKLEDKPIVVRPAVGDWPSEARRALAEWARKWK